MDSAKHHNNNKTPWEILGQLKTSLIWQRFFQEKFMLGDFSQNVNSASHSLMSWEKNSKILYKAIDDKPLWPTFNKDDKKLKVLEIIFLLHMA